MFAAINPRPEDVNLRLARLDLAADDLLTAVRAGVMARRTATAHHPRAYGGWRDYAERVAALRDVLVERGWVAKEPDGVCLTEHPLGRLAIMTAMGTAGTGTPEEVTTKRKRGERTEKVVRVNAQLAFDFPVDGEAQKQSTFDRPTWVLLVFVDRDEVRSELSLARHMDADGFIDEWLERIPLPVIRLNELFGSGGDGDGPDFDFDVPEKR